MKSIAQSLITTIFALAVISNHCNAAVIIRADFTAKVESIYDNANLLSSTVAVGQIGTGYFVYNTGLSDTNPDPNSGEYGPLTNFVFVLGGHTFQMNTQHPAGRMIVVNNQFFFGDTLYFNSSNNIDDITGPFNVTDISAELRQFEFQGATVFSSDNLPSSLALEDFTSFEDFAASGIGFSPGGQLLSIGFGPGSQQTINLNFTSLSTLVIPEPSRLALISMSAGLLLKRRRLPISEFRMPNNKGSIAARNEQANAPLVEQARLSL